MAGALARRGAPKLFRSDGRVRHSTSITTFTTPTAAVIGANAIKGWFGLALRLPQRHPFAFGVALTCAKTAAADVVVQSVVERREEIDWRRVRIFALFGAAIYFQMYYLWPMAHAPGVVSER